MKIGRFKIDPFLVIKDFSQKLKVCMGNLYLSVVVVFTILILVQAGLNTEFSLFYENSPPGQNLYIVSKLLGLVAIFLWASQVIFGALQYSSSMADLHKYMGCGLLFVLFLHISLFVLAVSIRGGVFSFDSIKIDFTKGFYTTSTSLGVIAVITLMLAVFGRVVQFLSEKVARTAHWLVLPGLVIAYFHAFRIGSDAYWNYIWLAVSTAVVLSLVFMFLKIKFISQNFR